VIVAEQRRAIATSCHPELAAETRVHERFLERVRAAGAATV
jgi:glutamine amidotransferase PdxT